MSLRATLGYGGVPLGGLNRVGRRYTLVRGSALPALDVPADPLVGAPTSRVFIVEPIEDPVPAAGGSCQPEPVEHRSVELPEEPEQLPETPTPEPPPFSANEREPGEAIDPAETGKPA